MSFRAPRLVPADLRGQVAGILLLGLVLSQLLAAGLYMVLLPRWQRVLRPESVVTRIEMAVRLLEGVDAGERARLVRLWNDEDFRISYRPAIAAVQANQASDARDEELRRRLATKLNRSADDIQVGALAIREVPDAKRIQVELRGGGAIEVVSSVGAEHRLGLVEQAGSAAFLVFATAGLWAWLTWTVNAPLTRVARAAEGVGLEIHSPMLA